MEEEDENRLNVESTTRLRIRRNQLRENVLTRSMPFNSSSNNEENRSETFSSEGSSNRLVLLPSINDENSRDDFQVFVNLSETSQNDRRSTDEHYQSFHSLSTVDFDGEEIDEEHSFVYATSINQDENESILHQHFLDDEDLSIEILLDASQNNSSITRSSISSRRQRRRRSILTSNLHSHRGLRPIDIRNIPQKFYNSLSDKTSTNCSICFEDFQSIDTIKILHCQHIFHAECLNEWLRSHVKCAYCRTPVLIDLFQRRPRRRIDEENRL